MQQSGGQFFEKVPASAALWARSAGVAKTFDTGQPVFHQGDIGDAVYFVESGSFEVRRYGPEGETLSLRTFGAGEYFGELAMLHDAGERTASVVATKPSTALVLHRAVFEHLRSLDNSVDASLLAETASRLRLFTEQATDYVFLTAEERVTKRLRTLADAFTTIEGEPLKIQVTQDSLAKMTGVTRQTVNRVLQTLADEGIIELSRGAITVIDRRALEKFR